MLVVPASPTALPGVLLAAATSGLLGAGVFVVVMTALGYVLGRFLSDGEPLFDVPGQQRAVSDDTRMWAREVLTDLEDGGTSEELIPLVRSIRTAAMVEELFSGSPLDDLLALLGDLGRPEDHDRAHRDQLLRLLSRIAQVAEGETRMRVLGALIKSMGRNRHVVPFLVEVCKRRPATWNDIQPSLEAAAEQDGSIARYLRDNADAKTDFVRRATEKYMTDMGHFRRLCEQRAAGMSAAVDPEIRKTLDDEFTFLKMAGTVTRRFVWLAPQARRFHPLITPDDIDLLLREAPSGQPEILALLGQLALTWAHEGRHERRVQRIISSLEHVARTHPSAGDALLEVYEGLRAEDAASTRPDREAVRRRAYFALLAAAEDSFEVIKLLGARGIPRDLYSGRDDG